jgi:hypothetical protein
VRGERGRGELHGKEERPCHAAGGKKKRLCRTSSITVEWGRAEGAANKSLVFLDSSVSSAAKDCMVGRAGRSQSVGTAWESRDRIVTSAKVTVHHFG